MPPGARVQDKHVCPMVDPPPHVGGPIIKGCDSVLVEGMPAARKGDPALCEGSGATTFIIQGSSTVDIGGMAAARIGDKHAHGGTVVKGATRTIIGDSKGQCMCAASGSAAAGISGGPSSV